MSRLLLLLGALVAAVVARTVRYSSVPPPGALTTKMYELAVPGSAPIRIIEAEPMWSTEEVPSTTPGTRDGLEHRSGKLQNSTGLELTTAETPTQAERVTYPADALNTFLKEYSDKIKADRKKYDEQEDSSSESGEIKDNKSKTWGLVDVQYHNHPYEDQKGWVTLEAVPWSTSKISKWQSHHTNPNKYEAKPWISSGVNKPQHNWQDHTYGNSLNKPPGNWDDHFHTTSRPTSNKYHPNKYHNADSIPSSAFFSDFDKPDVRPGPNFDSRPTYQDFSKPVYGYDQKPLHVKPEFPDWQLEMPSKPSWTKPIANQWNSKPAPEPWHYDKKPSPQFGYHSHKYGTNENPDIITDGRPGNFPTPYSLSLDSFEPLKDRPANSIHPPTHPANGNGEWVLLSTTKGYQYPRNKNQRSIEVSPDSIGARKGIRLTVLPPSNDTKINMTTSHGGLLEVESTFESVEESHKQFSERVKLKNKPKVATKVTRRPVKNHSVYAPQRPVAQKRPSAKPVSVIANKQDPTAVLAAVGAGMVPATMAMLVPFVAGRRRRSIAEKTYRKQRHFWKNNLAPSRI